MAAAVESKTRIDNRAPNNPLALQGGGVSLARTAPASNKLEPASPFVPAPPIYTHPAENVPLQSSAITAAQQPDGMETFPVTGARSVDAVIREIMRDSVKIDCVGAGSADSAVQLQLPPAIIPEELLQVGQAISISLETTGGFRRPIVRARQVGQQPNLPGQEEFEKWVEAL